MNTELRGSLVAQADLAFIMMVEQINILLDASAVFSSRNPVLTEIDKLKYRELKSAIFDLGSIPKMLADEIARWKRGEARVLSRDGVELNLLNELYANMESMLWFFTREQIEVPGFSINHVRAAHSELVRCNRLL